ncbi:rolling circle replication-associated protein [Castellaniella sp.]|uniref:rolling circle replication-associated protein n=2 Tax=Castellaniella sp. TaxID=1955812 RepID=UPI003C760AA4
MEISVPAVAIAAVQPPIGGSSACAIPTATSCRLPPSLPGPGIATSVCAVLVKKIKISGTHTPASPRKKARKAARRKLLGVLPQMKRLAPIHNLYAVCLTLTYRDAVTHQAKDLSRFLQRLRLQVRRLHPGTPLPYLSSFDRAEHGSIVDGLLHYHLVLWLPRGFRLEHDRLERWWPHGSTWTERCKNLRDWVHYITKPTSAIFPKGSHLYGYGGLDQTGKYAIGRSGWPIWLKRLIPYGEHAKRATGGGWVHIETGLWLESPWQWTPHGITFKPGPGWWIGSPVFKR